MNERFQRILGSLNEFQRAWVNLDFKLTRMPDGSRDDIKMEEILGQIHHMPKDIEEFITQPGGNPQYYLSDGGYSRVVWPTHGNSRLFLTDNSSSRAKAAWPDAQHERHFLEQLLRRDYDAIIAKERAEHAQGVQSRVEGKTAQQIVDSVLELSAAKAARSK